MITCRRAIESDLYLVLLHLDNGNPKIAFILKCHLPRAFLGTGAMTPPPSSPPFHDFSLEGLHVSEGVVTGETDTAFK